MDQQQQQNIDQAAQEWTEAVKNSFQTLADRTVTLQESNLRLTQNFFQQFVEQLQSQTQDLQQNAQTLQQQTVETLAQQSAEAYSDFLGSALSFYQEAMSQATQLAESNIRNAEQVAEQTVQSGSETAKQAALIATHVAQGTIASAAGWKTGRPVPISGPTSWTDDEITPSKRTAPDRTAAIQFLDKLLSEDSGYDEETWPEIAEALDRDRPSHRKLFVD